MRYKRLVRVLSFFAIIVIEACSTADDPDNEVAEAKREKKEDQSVETRRLNLLINDIPSPLEIATILSESRKPFDKTLMNPPEAAEKYNSVYKRAFNLGVYGADLNYAIVYEQSQEILTYLFTVQYMADLIDISNVVEASLVKRIEQNIASKDSLIELTFPIYKAIDKFLNANKKGNVATMILAGGWIEGLYLTTMVLNNEAQNKGNYFIYQKITQQRHSLEHLLALLMQHKDNPPEITPVIDMLLDIKTVYDETDEETLLSTDQVRRISEKVNKLRAVIV